MALMLKYTDEIDAGHAEIPPWLFFGWGDVEANGGKIGLKDFTVPSLGGEFGLWQLSAPERASIPGFDEARYLSDPAYAIQIGLQFFRQLAAQVQDFGYASDDDFFYFLAKLVHGIGHEGTRIILDDMNANGARPSSPSDMLNYFCSGDCPDPRTASYPVSEADRRVKDAIKAATGQVHYPAKWVYNANEVYARGKLLEASAGIFSALPSAIKDVIENPPPAALPVILVSLAAALIFLFRRSRKRRSQAARAA